MTDYSGTLLTKVVRVVMNSACWGVLANGLELVTQDLRPKSRSGFCCYEMCEIISSAVLFSHVLRTPCKIWLERDAWLAWLQGSCQSHFCFHCSQWAVPHFMNSVTENMSKILSKWKICSWLLCFWLWFYSLTRPGETMFSILLVNHGSTL